MNVKSKLSIIISTLGTRVEELRRLLQSLTEQTYKDFEIIVVSQSMHDVVEVILKEFPLNYRQVKTDRKGLSNARNIAVPYVSGDIVTFADDDCWYPSNAVETVVQDFATYAGEVICYQIEDPLQHVLYRNYFSKDIKTMKVRHIFQVSSIEIFINVKKVGRDSIHFDTEFGLGAKYVSGEENIFLCDLYKKKYNITHYPKVIVYHKKPKVTLLLNKQIFIGKGPMFRRMFNLPAAFILVILFYLKKKKSLGNEKMLLEALVETSKYKKPI
ncbi:glycosyltransferase family 2 protein [Ectobacillus antri]|jgi:glycosyltransferase involved in cell wall biosynthesis|uniref:Glycosyltransferase family 2 protein n=1 Tax=Ectobacillus antri TaxID=2486280 RepID=A0ABT6H9A7_9BACI|nr:glycosyltransferase family 2 protein [Ectobacillus antri]MDG4658553.1 glycosyltransferase family 2 protein [Ectobacillus antri]MDG5755557.1 glycosyltransferase family 2 protein [Ectobacillus antri]